jgi:hypothetical protein
VAVGLAGCQSSAPSQGTKPAWLPPTVPDTANIGDFTREELREAARLYTAKCARCHKFYDPAGYSDAEWRMWMNKMSRKARLKPEQSQLLSRYLETFRSTPK